MHLYSFTNPPQNRVTDLQGNVSFMGNKCMGMTDIIIAPKSGNLFKERSSVALKNIGFYAKSRSAEPTLWLFCM